MKSALIGYTGFVGSNIADQATFNDYYNSKNITTIADKKYDLIISAGTSSLKWLANKNPAEDWKKIEGLIRNLKKVRTNYFILISTVDVYPSANKVIESSTIDESQQQPYGHNRYKLEKFVKSQFPNYTIIRLPQTFGKNLKKNFIFDLLHENALDFTHKDSIFQWYNLKNIHKDITFAFENKLPILNLAVAPIPAFEVAEKVFNKSFNTMTKSPPVFYDMHSIYASNYHHKNYLYTKTQTIEELKKFVKQYSI